MVLGHPNDTGLEGASLGRYQRGETGMVDAKASGRGNILDQIAWEMARFMCAKLPGKGLFVVQL